MVNQFAARFEPGGEDTLYFHDAAAGGIPCSAEEAVALTTDYQRAVKRIARLFLFGVLVMAVILGAVSGLGVYDLKDWEATAIFLAPAPLALLAWKRAGDAPLEKFRDRIAVAPPRAQGAGWRRRFAALPDGVFIILGILGLLLLFQTFKDGAQSADALYAVMTLACFGLVLLRVRLRPPRG
jgi:membrane protease YdiL (CAAX protease family)